MKTALVVYDSAFGNTEKVARAIGQALAERQYTVNVLHIGQVTHDRLRGLDLLVVGAPTQKMGMTDPMKNFLEALPSDVLQGIHVAAFDTRITINETKSRVARFAMRVFLHRYAAEPIEVALKAKGAESVIVPEGFFVLDKEGPLADGELERIPSWVDQILHTVIA